MEEAWNSSFVEKNMTLKFLSNNVLTSNFKKALGSAFFGANILELI